MTRVATDSRVLAVAAGNSVDAAVYFTRRLAFETDCSDVYADLASGAGGFVLVDARSPEAFAAGHIPSAVNIPHASIDAEAVATLPPDAIAVTYCWGPHCNAATKAAARLAAHGYPVKEMLGGIDAWIAEGYPTDASD